MARLLRDRYFAHDADHVLDLATGEEVPLERREEEVAWREPPIAPLLEVLDHGREGTPRWVVADAAPSRGWKAIVRRAADDARARGFVAIAADVYWLVRGALAEEIGDRALVLIARPHLSMDMARAALVDAAARSPRPHVLLTFRAPAPHAPQAVREARAVYGAQVYRPRSPAPLPGDVIRHVMRGARAAEFVRAGRHAAAERLLRDMGGALVRRGARRQAADAYVALGRLALERGRAHDADTIFGEAGEHAAAAGDEAAAIGARIWQAAARTDAAHLTAAESLCRAVLVAGTVPDDERARAEATLARVLLWQRRVDEAAALGFLKAATAADLPPFAAATAVRVWLESGGLFEAGQFARTLLGATSAGDDPEASAMARTAHFRVLLATGDLTLAEECFAALSSGARAARLPLRLARARVLWVDALRRGGRARDAARELRSLQRIRAAAPPLLRAAIELRLKGDAAVRRPQVSVPFDGSAATSLITLAQREDDDRVALRAILAGSAAALRSSRIDVWSADAGPASVLLSAGAGLPTQLGPRVLDAGITIGPERGDPSHEICVPVRLGSRLLGAMAARWPVDRAAPAHASALIELAAAVAAPRLDSLVTAAREVSRVADAIPELIGASAAMADVRKAVSRAAAAPFAVLVEGESGVGKELVARAIHQLSPRRERRFCDVNCAALPDDLLESELFGHARGAFTGAVTDRAGLFEDADGGTIFLDEVADLSARAQAKLLRVLQQQELRRVGETFSRKVDVRVVSAANRDLCAEADGGRFRQDLRYRLDVIRIRIPPLRERPEDVPLLADHFWRTAAARVGTAATLTHPVVAALARYHWPGNVRELQNVIATLAVEAPARGHVRSAMLTAIVTGVAAVTSGRLADARTQFERRFVEMALARAGGSRTRAARELGLSRQGLLKLLARLGLSGGRGPTAD